MAKQSTTVMHVMHRFAVGGLENGVVNIINHLPSQHYQHVIVSLTDYDHSFATRLTARNVTIRCLHKKNGKDLGLMWRAFRLMWEIKPDVIHTRNLSAIELLFPAWLARIPKRIHSEHGRDQSDADGNSTKNQRIRRVFLRFAQRVVALSKEIEQYLRNKVGIKNIAVQIICNGVDCLRFTPKEPDVSSDDGGLRFIYVGRFQAVKNPMLVLQAFHQLANKHPSKALRLTMVGDGAEWAECQAYVQQHQLQGRVELVGASKDVVSYMQSAEVFLLGSNAEGISNTILEAMACGLAVIATNVGGNAELVVANETGYIVPQADCCAFTDAMERYVLDRTLLAEHRGKARQRVLERFSLQGMMDSYHRLYQWQ